MPWQAFSNFEVNEKGVQEIVRFPGSEGASIVVPIQDGDKLSGFDYVYDVYDIVGDRVQRITGVRSDAKWPVVPQNKSDVVAHHQLDTLSTIESPKEGQDDSFFRIKNLSRSPANDVVIERENGDPIGMPQILVVDKAERARSIIFEPSEDDLRTLIKANATAQIIGQRCNWHECNPLILKTTLTR
ncbi:MAG TPA: hypothetical protein VIX42_01805 [Edaphobacter sp.]